MDNQQVTKNWFIGFLEGEGCFIAGRLRENYRNEMVNGQKCQVRISNTEIDLIQACQQFLSQNMIRNYVVTSRRGKNKPMHEVYISGPQECMILYQLIKDDMHCRIHELEGILGTSTTTRETSLSLEWLAGLYEAEACLTVSCRYRSFGKIDYTPEIVMENTHEGITRKTVSILSSLGLPHYVYDRVPSNSDYKPFQRIMISGFKRVNRFLERTSGLWFGSKTRRKAQLIREFCDSRFARDPKDSYSEREHEIVQLVKMKI